MSLLERAGAIVAKLALADLAATTDPRKAASNGGRPIVLVAPPSIDYTTRLVTWTLVVTRGQAAPDLETFSILDGHAAQVAEVLPVESARPSSYQLVGDQPAVPAYMLTLTTV